VYDLLQQFDEPLAALDLIEVELPGKLPCLIQTFEDLSLDLPGLWFAF